MLTLGATAVPSLRQALANRLAHGRPAQLISQDAHLDLVPAQEKSSAEIREHGLRLAVTEQLSRELTESVRPEAGEYPLENAEAIVIVERSVLRDADGNEVRTIG